MKSTHSATVVVFSMVLAASALGQGLTNGDFGDGLTGWTVTQEGGSATPGEIVIVGTQAELREGDSYLVVLAQSFVAPVGMITLSFDVDMTPGFDTEAAFHPDAFEVFLLDGENTPVVSGFETTASAYFNAQEGGETRLGAQASVDGDTVTLDVSGVKSGSELSLVLHLLGADPDKGSAVRVGNFVVGFDNVGPTAFAGDDQTLECADPLVATLDGSASADPDDDELAYVWKAADGAEVGSTVKTEVAVSLGEQSYTLTVDDGHPSTSPHSDTVVVTVVDTTGPEVVSVPDAVEVPANGSCAGVVPDLVDQVTGEDACGGEVTVAQLPAAGTSLVLGEATTVSFVLTDARGNTTQSSTPVTLVDNTPPIGEAVPPMTVSADGDCAGAVGDVTGVPQTSDNCPGAVMVAQSPDVDVALTLGQPAGVTFTLTDAAGNTAQIEGTITLVDTTPPSAEAVGGTASVDAGVSCELVVPDLATDAPVTDNCGVPTVAQDVAVGSVGAGEQAVKLTVTDAAGNSIEHSVLVSAVDNEPPQITDPLAAQNVAADAVCAGTLGTALGQPKAKDNCATELTITRLTSADTALVLGEAVDVVFEVKDAAGNTTLSASSVTMVDQTPPEITEPLAGLEAIADDSCAGAVGTLTGAPEAKDNCTADLTITQLTGAESALVLGEAVEVVFEVKDAAGNTTLSTSSVTMVDQTPPVIGAAPAPISVVADGACAGVLPAVSLDSVSDNCPGEPQISQDVPVGTSLMLGALTTLKLTVTDAAGNESKAETTATLVDQTPPVLEASTAAVERVVDEQCEAEVGDVTGLATWTDNCSDVSVAQLPAADTLVAVGTGVGAVLTATDGAGNEANTEITVSAVDTTPPVVDWDAATVSLEADAECSATLTELAVTATDNCPGEVLVVQVPAVGSVLGLGETPITMEVTDASANGQVLETSAVVVDVTPPTIHTAFVPTVVTANAACQGNVPALDVEAMDNCTVVAELTWAQEPPSGEALALDVPREVILTVTDAAQNSAQANTTVTLTAPPDHACGDQPHNPDEDQTAEGDSPAVPDEGEPNTGDDISASTGGDTESTPNDDEDASGQAPLPPGIADGCGCRTQPGPDRSLPLGPVLLLLLGLTGMGLRRIFEESDVPSA